tara:strand:- start:1598 stop:2005 length:408 start_codon:yes stop_codon:yes gene_type:complete
MLYLELLPDEVYQLVYKNIYDGVVLELNDLIKRNSYMTDTHYSDNFFIWRLMKVKFFKHQIYREPNNNLMFRLNWYRSLYPLRLVFSCRYGWEMETRTCKYVNKDKLIKICRDNGISIPLKKLKRVDLIKVVMTI